MRDQPSLNRNTTSAPLHLFDRPEFCLFLYGCKFILIEWTFYYFIICKCMSIIAQFIGNNNGTVQFTFFLVMKLRTLPLPRVAIC